MHASGALVGPTRGSPASPGRRKRLRSLLLELLGATWMRSSPEASCIQRVPAAAEVSECSSHFDKTGAGNTDVRMESSWWYDDAFAD
jgi:hypothetical protein